MITIHKYELHSRKLKMPKGAKVLSIQKQGDLFCLWAQVETENELEPRYFERAGTGWEIEASDLPFMVYLASVQDGPYVWHFFEVTKEK